ncbi:MAG TPA: ABC transporter permease, partial [Thermodesulfobacteriota bacterium]
MRLPALRQQSLGGSVRYYSPVASVLLLAPLALLLIGLFAYPIGRLLAASLWDPSFTLVHYRRLFAEPLYLAILLRTIRIAALVTVAALVLGYPLAYVMARARGWRATLLAACVLVPLWTSVLVRSYAWTVLLQRNGLVNTLLRRLGIVDEPLQLLYT